MDMMLFARSMGGLSAVLALLAIALFIVRKFDVKLPGRVGGAQRGRIGVVERITIDPKRSLLLVHQDGCEHLVLLSPEGHVVLNKTERTEAQARSKIAAVAADPVADAELSLDTAQSSEPVRNDEPCLDFEQWLEEAELSASQHPANDTGIRRIKLRRHA